MNQEDSRISLLDPSLFTHSLKGRVKTFEVDRQNIVHNVIYMYWLENARVEYVRAIGVTITPQTFIDHLTFVVAKTEVQYLAPALFDQEYCILTRIPSIGNTSFIFEQLIQLKDDSQQLVMATSILVQLDPQTRQPLPISKEFRDLVSSYEIHSKVIGA